MKFIDLINAVPLEEVDVWTEDEDVQNASIVELNRTTITEAGQERWKRVLNSEVVKIRHANITLSGCSAEELYKFTMALAGYIPESLFDEWFVLGGLDE